jgi:hypothetical protein
MGEETMVAFVKDNMTPTVLLIEAENRWHMAFVPEEMDAADVAAAFDELGISPEKVCEVKTWLETADGRMVVGTLPVRSVG